MPQQRHTEHSILTNYLLPHSQLPTILPYPEFLQLVPTQHRSHPHLKRLYRDLQFQRTIDVDTVRQNIEREVARGVVSKSQLARQVAAENGRVDVEIDEQKAKKRKRMSGDDDDGTPEGKIDELTNPTDIAVDATYLDTSIHPSHTASNLPPSTNHPLTAGTRRNHTATSLLTAMDSTSADLESEISELESESAELLAEMNEIVGALSDLRYGRFAKPMSGGYDGAETTIETEVVEALHELERKLGEPVK